MSTYDRTESAIAEALNRVDLDEYVDAVMDLLDGFVEWDDADEEAAR